MYEKNKNKNKKQSKIYEQEPLALFSLREEIGQNSNQWDSACLRPRAHRSPECHGRRTESPHRPQVKGSLLRDRAAGTVSYRGPLGMETAVDVLSHHWEHSRLRPFVRAPTTLEVEW